MHQRIFLRVSNDEKPLGTTKPKLKVERIQLPISVAEVNREKCKPSWEAVDYSFRHTSSTTLNRDRQK